MRAVAPGRQMSAIDLLARTVGLGYARTWLSNAAMISVDQAKVLIELISTERFFDTQKIEILSLLARRAELHEVAGKFAQHVAHGIRQGDDIGHRGGLYLKLVAALMPMGENEARAYYQQGLSQLDQMGGESYEQIYSLLHFAEAQRGGFLKPASAQRLMNLCQAILRDEPSKFGWTLFGRAAASSIGPSAIAKLVRWHDQDVVNISYGLPQLACSLAIKGHLDLRRAAFLLLICEDHGWWDWHPWEAVAGLMARSGPDDQRRIFQTVIKKMRAEHTFGGWPSLWQGMLETADQYPAMKRKRDASAVIDISGELIALNQTDSGRSCPATFHGSRSPTLLIGWSAMLVSTWRR